MGNEDKYPEVYGERMERLKRINSRRVMKCLNESSRTKDFNLSKSRPKKSKPTRGVINLNDYSYEDVIFKK
jgi:hypothetical protein